jgi:hypothetical protein
MAWQLLFGSDIGLFSVFTIGFVIVMMIFFIAFFSKHIDEDAKKAAAKQ